MTNKIIHPDIEAAVDEMAVYLSSEGQVLQFRDKDRLGNIMGRVQQFAEYKPQADVAMLTAILIETVVQTHIFVDGNKRFALLLAYAFLGLNGYVLDMREIGNNSAHELVVGVVEKSISVEQAAEIIRNNMDFVDT